MKNIKEKLKEIETKRLEKVAASCDQLLSKIEQQTHRDLKRFGKKILKWKEKGKLVTETVENVIFYDVEFKIPKLKQ